MAEVLVAHTCLAIALDVVLDRLLHDLNKFQLACALIVLVVVNLWSVRFIFRTWMDIFFVLRIFSGLNVNI